MRLWQILVLSIAWQPMASAQSSEFSPLTLNHATELGFTTGGAMDLPGGAHGGEFWAVQLRWGRVLTAPHGPGPLRGRLEYVIEIVPAIVLREAHAATTCNVVSSSAFFDPCAFSISVGDSGAIYGGGINPFFWQYNFTSHPRIVPYINLGAGMLFSTRDFPTGTSSFNFTPQGGIGAYWFARPDRAMNFGLRYHHISNAGISKPNPGHNALYFFVGLSWWR